MNANRRDFLKSASLGGAAFLSLKPRATFAAPSEQVNLGFIGMGGRSLELIDSFKRIKGVRLAAFCDVDSERAEAAGKANGVDALFTNYEDLLSDPSIDAVVIATCNHWHCLAAIHACQAGKHVYVEKPLGHDLWQQEQLIAAAKQGGRVVQIGTQQRSDPMQAQIKRFLHEEKALGEIQGVITCRLGSRAPIGKRDQPLEAPKTVDVDRWFGPTEPRPLYRDKFHYDWHWDFATGDGEMGNWGVHILDDVRNVVLRDAVRFPSSAVALGARAVWDDAGDTPNVHAMLLDCGGLPVTCVVNNVPAPKGQPAPRIDGVSTGYVVYAEGGQYRGERGGGAAYDRDGKRVRRFRGTTGQYEHARNFIDAVRSGDPGQLNAPVEIGHASTALCHYGNLAYLAGEQTPGQEALASAEDDSVWGRTLGSVRGWMEQHDLSILSEPFVMGRKVSIDPDTGEVADSLPDAAPRIVRGPYREAYAIPEIG